ncbi:hypothetical protein FNF27_05390 [Cafeteria roenbergensis]|uniref:Methyltransferase small domain-containing protein n=1 Tax=Cafeteria roenbergensis TaxID=33653 RepID=A0A5A8E647_CAFRO|nr:hypothetical protein FNF27_05390 [Cafeteria roenbergensis]
MDGTAGASGFRLAVAVARELPLGSPAFMAVSDAVEGFLAGRQLRHEAAATLARLLSKHPHLLALADDAVPGVLAAAHGKPSHGAAGSDVFAAAQRGQAHSAAWHAPADAGSGSHSAAGPVAAARKAMAEGRLSAAVKLLCGAAADVDSGSSQERSVLSALACASRLRMLEVATTRAGNADGIARSVADAVAEHKAEHAPLFLFEGVDDHLGYLQDVGRTEAYKAALEKLVKPGQHVLEVGTGTGVLAMLAAGAGAGRVSAIERVPWVARAARDVVAANGLAGTVSVLQAASTSVGVAGETAAGAASGGDDGSATIPDRADVFVSELVGNQLVDEGCGFYVDDARRRLCKPEATVIPASGAVWGAVISSQSMRRRRLPPLSKMGTHYGLTFEPFNSLFPERGVHSQLPPLVSQEQPDAAEAVAAAARAMKRLEDEYDDASERAADEDAAAVLTECPDTVDEEDLAVADGEVDPVALDQGKYDFLSLSRPFPLVEADYQSGPAKLTSSSTLEVQIQRSGEAVAVLAWVTLDMDSEGDIRLTTCPRALAKEAKLDGIGVFRAGNWALRCMQFDAPLAVKKGDTLVLDVAASDAATCRDEKGDAESGEGSDGESGEGSDGESGEGSDGESGEGSDGESGEGSDAESGEGSDGESGEGSSQEDGDSDGASSRDD